MRKSPYELKTSLSIRLKIYFLNHMARTGPAHAFIVKRLGKSPFEGCTHYREQGLKTPYGPARNTYCSVQCNFRGFPCFKHSSYLHPEKQRLQNILDKVSVQIFVTYFVHTSYSECS